MVRGDAPLSFSKEVVETSEIGEDAMPFQAVPNGVSVVFAATQNTVPIVNVYHVKTPGTVSDADLTNIVEAFHTWWQTDIQANTNITYVLNTITGTDLSVEDGHQYVKTLSTDNTGTVTGAAAAGNAALVVSWRTANIGRSFRGRTYVGGLPQGALADAQHVQGATAANMATFATDLIDTLSGLGYTLSVLSRVANGVVRVTGLLTEIISVIVDTKIDSQRRRTAN